MRSPLFPFIFPSNCRLSSSQMVQREGKTALGISKYYKRLKNKCSGKKKIYIKRKLQSWNFAEQDFQGYLLFICLQRNLKLCCLAACPPSIWRSLHLWEIKGAQSRESKGQKRWAWKDLSSLQAAVLYTSPPLTAASWVRLWQEAVRCFKLRCSYQKLFKS